MAKINQIQVSGTNHDICSADSFTVSLAVASWSNKQQIVSNSKFQASGYAYIITPVSESLQAYADSQIYADDISTNGQIVFHCESVPTSNITVNITRMVVL